MLRYDGQSSPIYNEALRHGDLLFAAAAAPAGTLSHRSPAQLHHVHHMGYFDWEWLEQIPIIVDPG
jgi:hypothetical protein